MVAMRRSYFVIRILEPDTYFNHMTAASYAHRNSIFNLFLSLSLSISELQNMSEGIRERVSFAASHD